MRDEANEIVVSAATAWGNCHQEGDRELCFDRPIVAAVLALGFEILAVVGAHAEHSGGLPPHQSDPFDRMIIAQAIWREWFSGRKAGGWCPMA
jgi:PIN domain nuclease of toxin-antitoxin system